MGKSNKQVISELTEYFMTQDRKNVCKTLASMLIDLNRIVNFRDLPEKERVSLFERTDLNIKQLHEFIKNGSKEDLILHTWDSE